MQQYLGLLQAILDNGVKTGDRTGTGTMTLPGYHYTCEMHQDGDGVIHNFPLLTTKFVSLESVFQELMWKLNGDTNIRRLVEQNNHIWTEWPFENWLKATGQTKLIQNKWKDAKKSEYSDDWKKAKKAFEIIILENDVFCKKWGELGRTYGHQFRRHEEVYFDDLSEDLREAFVTGMKEVPHVIIKGEDQLMNAIELIKHNPEDRRIIIDLWSARDKKKTLLPPCPTFYQFFANEPGMLHLNMYQRSCDTFLGVPYNTAQDSLLLCMMAHVTGRKPGRFNHFFGDAHVYLNHIDQVNEQISRAPHQLPSIRLNPDVKNILDFTWNDIELIGYEHEKGIKGAVSI
jgi:thymidylate synthase